jgi:ATP-binding cassette, subfamily B (MDR/TAP), member 1
LWLRNGGVSIGGKTLSEVDVKWWRSQIGLVQQDNVMFNDTIYRNIEYGLVGTEWEHAETDIKTKLIQDACDLAFAHAFIIRLPDVSWHSSAEFRAPGL